MLRDATVYISQSQPLHVLQIEETASQTITTLYGRELHLRRAVTAGGVEDWIPEEIIVRVEED